MGYPLRRLRIRVAPASGRQRTGGTPALPPRAGEDARAPRPLRRYSRPARCICRTLFA